MDLTRALSWSPPDGWPMRVVVVDAHTGGEPFRVVVDGLPDIPGETVLDRRRYAHERFDHLRKALMWEPRGHSDMYGGWPGPPLSPEADLSVLFVHNEGFSTMCGHGIIALAKVVIDTGMIPSEEPETTLRIDTPAGLVVATSRLENGSVVATRFRNVASFAADIEATVDVPGMGTVVYDLGFGGAFYAVVDSAPLDLALDDPAALVAAGRRIKSAIVSSRSIEHPESEDLGFLYGVIFTGPPASQGNHSRNVCVFANGEIDRSPTGTGVSARLAILFERGEVALDERVVVESIVGSEFEGRVVETLELDHHRVVIPEITGVAHITGRNELWLDPSDSLGRGFFLR